MKKLFAVWSLGAFLASGTMAQQKPVEIPLWPDGERISNGLTGPEQVDLEYGYVRNVSSPTLTIYLAQDPNGLCVISCPGGAYLFVSMKYEGYDMADWFTSRGITYAVLKYRLPNGRAEVPLEDARQALKIMRGKAKELGFTKLGMIGASAGGHLVASVATRLPAHERPDFQALIYPLITLRDRPYQERYAEVMGHTELSPEQIDALSLETQVDAQTPPAFVVHSADDPVVPADDSILYFRALRRQGVSASLHIYPDGGHGWAMKDSFRYKTEWTQELDKWLRSLSR